METLAVSDDDRVELEPRLVAERYPLPIAGCLSRLVAWLIDTMILATGLLILSLVFSSYFYRIGPSGRCVGFAIAVGYLTYFTSYLGKGQTPGKRLLKIQVTNEYGHPLSIRRALVRSGVLCLVFFLNGWRHPIVMEWPLFTVVAGIILFGGLLTILYGLIFNRSARQGPHDLLVGSYVASAKRDPYSAFRAVKTRHYHVWITFGIFGVLAVIVWGVLAFGPGISSHSKAMIDLANKMNEDDRILSTNMSGSVDHKHLTVSVWYRDEFPEDDGKTLSYEIATLVANEYKYANQLTSLRVVIFRAIDLGFTNRSLSVSWNFNFSGQ